MHVWNFYWVLVSRSTSIQKMKVLALIPVEQDQKAKKRKKNGSTGGIVSQQEPQGLTTGLTGEKSP